LDAGKNAHGIRVGDSWKEEFDLFSRIFSVSAMRFENLAPLLFVAARFEIAGQCEKGSFT
jgi:hypothetical protein